MTKSHYRTLWLMNNNAISDLYKIIQGIPEEQWHAKGKDAFTKDVDIDKEVTINTDDKLSAVLERLKELNEELKTAKEVSEQPA